MTEMTSPPVARRRFPKAYVAVWALLATLSLAYLALLAAEPELVASYVGMSGTTTAQTTPAVDTVAELRTLRDSIDRVAGDLTDLKSEVSKQADRDSGVAGRVAALEVAAENARIAALPAAPATAPGAKGTKVAAAEPTKAAPDAKAPAKKQGTVGAEAAAPAVAAPPVTTTADVRRSLETGSVESKAPVAFGPAVVTPAGAPVGLKIATGPSVDSLRLSWSLLSGRHDQSLASLEPRYVTGSDASGLTYDLIVGPVASTADAKRICKELVLKGTPCQIGDFAGDAL